MDKFFFLKYQLKLFVKTLFEIEEDSNSEIFF